MKILTIHPLWAWAIVYAGKDVENRTWATKYRGPLGIHAAKGAANYGVIADFIRRLGYAPPTLAELRDRGMTGAIVGTVNLVGKKTDSPWYLGNDWCNPIHLRYPENSGHRDILCYRFGDVETVKKYQDCHGWHLVNSVALDAPIPAKGQLGLWDFDLE